MKEVEFECSNGLTYARGYFAIKDKMKYFLEEKLIPHLPIKIGIAIEELFYKTSSSVKDIIVRPLQPIPFRIKPEKKFKSYKALIDEFVCFEHTDPDQWIVSKIVCLVGYISKVFVCVASNPEFGKSSVYEVVHGLTDMCPVFKPRSVPGVLNKINGIGNIVFDDVLEAKKEVRNIMEEFSIQVGGGKPVYINGAMKSQNTKNKYNCSNQSITYLYNNADCYKSPEKNYYETFFENNKAINTRFLKLKFDGTLTEKFSKDFNMKQVAEENKMYYITLTKHLAWMQEQREQNKFTRRWIVNTETNLKGRRKHIYDEITLFIDNYCKSQQEMDKFISVLDNSINEYTSMVDSINRERTVFEQWT